MADTNKDSINFDKLENELYAALDADQKYWRENDAKFRAVHQKVATYEEFRDIVLASHLKPLEKTDKMPEHFVQPWNNSASKEKDKDLKSDTKIAQAKKLPKNGHEFARDWRRYCKTPEEKRTFLFTIGAGNLATIFHSEISFGLLGDIIEALQGFEYEQVNDVAAIMESLTLTNRFGLSLQFLDSKEKENCEALFNRMQEAINTTTEATRSEQGCQLTAEQLQALGQKYEIK